MGTTLDESSRRAGCHRWVESRLYEILGGWVAGTAEPEIRLLLDRHSHHCAWRAGQWWDRLPVLADVDREALCRPPSDRVAEALEHLAGVDGTAARLAGAYRVALPRLWSAYDRHGRHADPVADGSTLRTLGFVSPDVAADWREGEQQLQGILVDQAQIGAAAAAVSAMEGILAAED
ncbi:MAG TPA: hypothetical protein VFH58_03220 [Acidimicrobiales bacterium]|nr:hypothetical protein [Acidimicrobiales bacterium]